MDCRKVVSYLLGISVGLLAVAPPMNYSVPLVVNSYIWLYGIVVTLLLCAYLFFTSFPLSLKILVAYLSVGCFISLVPYLSFNALILVCVAAYVFLWFAKNDVGPLLNMVAAAFIVQLLFGVMQLFAMDKLMNFGRKDIVFFGSVMQYMRFGSLLAIMTPILVFKSKWFIVPVVIAAIISQSSSFALAVIFGCVVYVFVKHRSIRFWGMVFGIALALAYLWYDKGSVITELECGRWKVWQDIIRTWLMDTSRNWVLPLAGPVDWKSIFFGRGMDTFMPLFPVFKHDMNPFAQAHNCHLQLLWETGCIGYGLLVAYVSNLIYRIRNYPVLLAGMGCMLVNMFFAFPTRMTQTFMMMVAFMGLCEQMARRAEAKGECYA